MIDELVAQAAPLTDDELEALDVDALALELAEAIMRTPRAVAPRAPRRLRLVAAMAVAACAALVLAGTSLLGSASTGGPAFAAAAIRVANAVPRLLLGEPGWRVERADEFSVGAGEMTFGDGSRSFDLSWTAARPGRELVQSRAGDPSLRPVGTAKVAGRPARIYRYAGTADDFTAVWREGGYVLEFRGAPGARRAHTLDEFERALVTLRPASVADWLSAMPASVVLPVDRGVAVRTMLSGIPLPAGFDAAKLAAGEELHDRYQLGARVAGAAACAWTAQWVRAKRDGDRAAQAAAVAAMRTARAWPILREMAPQGAFSQEVWMYADAIAGPGTVVGGKVLTVEESYRAALGCGQPG